MYFLTNFEVWLIFFPQFFFLFEKQFSTLGSGKNKPARLLFSRQFSRGHGPYFRPMTENFLEKVHFLFEISTIFYKNCYFSA